MGRSWQILSGTDSSKLRKGVDGRLFRLYARNGARLTCLPGVDESVIHRLFFISPRGYGWAVRRVLSVRFSGGLTLHPGDVWELVGGVWDCCVWHCASYARILEFNTFTLSTRSRMSLAQAPCACFSCSSSKYSW
eukprot:1564473-Prymnesium_polylepis.1